MTDEECGYIKNDGDPCTFPAKHSDGRCGHHTDETETTTGANSKLTENPELVSLIPEEIKTGSTISEALAEVDEKTGIYVPESTHGNWMQKGKMDGSDDIYTEYRKGVTRARKQAARSDRRNLKQHCVENGDTRTWHKIHKEQYGDLYDEQLNEEEVTAPFAIPEKLMQEWQQQETSPQ